MVKDRKRRENTVMVRMTDEEAEAVAKAAEKERRPVAVFVRHAAIDAAKRAK